MGNDTVPHLERKVQSTRISARPLFEQIDDSKALKLMPEDDIRIVFLRTALQHLFTGVSERCMAKVMAECDRLNKIEVQVQRAGDRGGNILYIDDMFETGADMVILRIKEHLCLVPEPSESLTVDDTACIPLERRSDKTGFFVESSSTAVLRMESIGRQILLTLITKDRQQLTVTRIVDSFALLLQMGELGRKLVKQRLFLIIHVVILLTCLVYHYSVCSL